MKIIEQGDGIVQGAGCGSVVGESSSEEATFQLRPEGNGLVKGGLAVRHFKQRKHKSRARQV